METIRTRELADRGSELEARIEERLVERARRGERSHFASRPIADVLIGDEPERLNVTLLVCDLTGVPSLAERVEPEDLATMLEAYLREAVAVATEHEAAFEGIAGERIALLFGASRRCEPRAHALSAIRAAMALRGCASEIGARAKRRGLVVETRSRIAISTGFCSVGAVGGSDLRTYSAAGYARAIATELAADAEAGSIVLSESTWVLVRDVVEARPLIPASPALRSVRRFELGARGAAPEIETARYGPSQTRSLSKEGDFWTLRFDGAVLRVKDSKGMACLALLLASPNTKLHALDLVAKGMADDASADAGDAGPVLDRPAREAYRRRLDELREEHQEATAANDRARAERLTEEMDALSCELAQAYGLGGRERRAASVIERARVNVTRNIKDALKRIERLHTACGRYLAMSVRTGVLCVYAPPDEIPWEVSLGGAWSRRS